MTEAISFRDDETTRKYIDTAICENIQHSLECLEFGHYFRHLHDLYDAGELTSAINRIIEDMNHRFVLKVLTKDFQSSDYGITARNLRMEKDEEKRTNILDQIDRESITQRLMEILDIRNKEQQTVPLTESHVILIKKYLEALDLISNCCQMKKNNMFLSVYWKKLEEECWKTLFCWKHLKRLGKITMCLSCSSSKVNLIW